MNAMLKPINPAPDALAILRSCEPTPALVRMLADTAAAWAKQGRTDDALAALSLGLCARSALEAQSVPIKK